MANTGPGFNHNDFYHRFLLRRVPPGCGRALDVGCGTGLFARRLAQRAHAVVGIDQDPAVITTARALSMGTPNIDYIQAVLADCDLGDQSYDYICCIAGIHHMLFAETVTRLREALTPGGALAIVGCYRQATWADYLPDLIAIPANRAANAAVKAIVRHSSIPVPQVNTAPVAQPQMTLSEIKSEAQRVLRGAVVGRRLFWRYSLTCTHRPTAAR